VDQFVIRGQMNGEESSIKIAGKNGSSASYTKGQRIRWLGHITRKSGN